MAWLGTYLAARGYIVAAVNHPGNNAVTGYTTLGFIEGWERAKDISTVISDMLAIHALARRSILIASARPGFPMADTP